MKRGRVLKRRYGRASSGGVDLVIAYYGDHALFGATRRGGSNPRYWIGLRLEHEPHSLYWARGVPEKLAAELEAQGTSDQEFSDGYTAARAAAPYVEAEPFYEYEGGAH